MRFKEMSIYGTVPLQARSKARVAAEAASALLAAGPAGVVFYYISVLCFAELQAAGAPLPAFLSYWTLPTLVMLGIASAILIFNFCWGLSTLGFRVLARVLPVPTLAVVVVLLVLTARHHGPFLPFYGQ